MSLHYFELPKLPASLNAEDEMGLWLALFSAETEEELAKIQALEVPEMEQTIEAYRTITTTEEFRELERLRSKARHDEAQALHHAMLVGEARGEERASAKWQGVVAEQAALIAELRARLGESE